ncbi:hypothetical protein PInf_002793 [Phytophthora infestans]|nr:hypothetical protein PInf_002793 [Phytophthora infestans]
MESLSLLAGLRGQQSTRCRFPEPHNVDADNFTTNGAPESKNTRRSSQSREFWGLAHLSALPWFGWLFVYTYVLLCFSTTRCLALGALVEMYGSPQDYTMGFKTSALGLGLMEDFVCTTYFATTLWAFDVLKRRVTGQLSTKDSGVSTGVAGNAATFVVSWLLFVVMMAPFVSDLMLVAYRNMRFTDELVAALLRERHHLNAAPISTEEIQRGYEAATVLVIVAAAFGFVRTTASCTDLSSWNPTHLVAEYLGPRTHSAVGGPKYVELTLEDGAVDEESENKLNASAVVVFVGLVAFPAVVVAISNACSPLVAYSGLNATLDEIFGHALQPTPTEALLTGVKGDQPWVEMYIHPTEQHELFGNDTLYRRTTGFQGSLAFEVDVSTDNPPNVLVIGVESFRFQDSRYLVGEEDPSNLFKGTNLTITPNFDRWAKRGVALRNIWSSNPTSRSLESLLFAQVPYDSATKTGITGGRKDTKLAGLPQLFDAKGYETFFTTGSSITLDKWNVFLPSHGYQEVWEAKAMLTLGEKHLKIRRHQWFGPEHLAFNWGVHDDLSFRLLGDLLRQKTKKQKQRVAKGKPKKPLFLTHFTISSHGPFKARPTWYAKAAKPDFSALYEGHERAAEIKNYLEMRYFTDMELGKFMDRMEKGGILNDTIVVIIGDHGQAPEAEIMNTHEDPRIIAEGRLGKYAGAIIDDAAEQYDILNTLADITGLPEGGFVQNGVGRSLKRKAKNGERPVFTNDPNRKMAIVRGHQRLRYDRVTDAMLLHDTERDHAMTTDLFPELAPDKQEEWNALRDSGRRITAYYKKRWDENCLLAVDCIEER